MNVQGEAIDYTPGPVPPGIPEVIPTLEPRWLDYGRDRRLFYLCGGAVDGPPVLFIHGLEGWAEQWLPTLAAFPHYRWLIPDLPGFGRSSAPERASRASFTEGLLRLLDAERAERAVVVGNSMGGGVALGLALDEPARVERVVAATAAGILRRVVLGFKLAMMPILGEALLSNRRVLNRIRWRMQFGNQDLVTNDFLDQVTRFRATYDCRPTYLGLLRSSANFFGLTDVLTEQLPTLSQPLLLAWGTRDRVIPVTHAYYAARVIPRARLELFEGAGHYPHWEQPERFNRLVREFLSEAPAAVA